MVNTLEWTWTSRRDATRYEKKRRDFTAYNATIRTTGGCWTVRGERWIVNSIVNMLRGDQAAAARHNTTGNNNCKVRQVSSMKDIAATAAWLAILRLVLVPTVPIYGSCTYRSPFFRQPSVRLSVRLPADQRLCALCCIQKSARK